MELHNTALEADCLCIDQGCGHFRPRLPYDSSEGRPGNIHPAGRFLLAQALHIRKADRLQLIYGQYRQIRRLYGQCLRHEAHTGWIKADPTGFNGTGHSTAPSFNRSYKHMLIINLVPRGIIVKAFFATPAR
jgi:hypothetical protein